MIKQTLLLGLMATLACIKAVAGPTCDSCKAQKAKKSSIDEADYIIMGASVKHNKKWGQLEFEIIVQGTAGRSVSKPAGKMNGAPVDGYVFPTSLT